MGFMGECGHQLLKYLPESRITTTTTDKEIFIYL